MEWEVRRLKHVFGGVFPEVRFIGAGRIIFRINFSRISGENGKRLY